MASWSDLPVVRFAPSTTVSDGERVEWLLWPALAWRVIGPRPRERALNLVQRAVLGMLVAGRRTADEIAGRLCLHRELVALVIHELEAAGALDGAQRPTSRGRELLSEEDDDTHDDVVVARVFSDPFSGELWPRLIERDLPLATVERGEKGWPQIVTGTHGAPRRDRPYVVSMPSPPVARAPSPKEILRASRLHARHLIDGNDDAEPDERPSRLDRVACLTDDCERVMLAVRVRVGAGDWSIDDPFGVGESQRMRRAIERRVDAERAERGRSPLRERLVPEVDEALAKTLQGLQALAMFKVERRIPAVIRADEALVERLVAMQRAHLEASQAESPRDKREDVVVKAQQAVEHLFGDLLNRHRDRADALALTGDEAVNAALYEGIARDCGFEVPLPKTLVGVRAGKVRSALESRTGSLRPLVIAALLGARARPDHPLRLAGARCPTLLGRLDALARERDPAAHGGRRRRQTRDPIDVIEVAFDAIEQLLPR